MPESQNMSVPNVKWEFFKQVSNFWQGQADTNIQTFRAANSSTERNSSSTTECAQEGD